VGEIIDPAGKRRRGGAFLRRLYFRGDAAFANPEMYEFLEAERMGYTIRLPANHVLQDRIGYLLKRRVGRPPHEVRSNGRGCHAALSPPMSSASSSLTRWAYNLGNFMRTLAMPEAAEPWSLTSLREADQDRREGGEPRSLRDLPVG